MNPIVKVNKIYPDAHIPTYGSEKAACADVYAYIPREEADLFDEHGNPIIYMRPHETCTIGTGLRFAPAEGWAILGYARSGLATKRGLAPANCVGVIDEDYRGQAMVPLLITLMYPRKLSMVIASPSLCLFRIIRRSLM